MYNSVEDALKVPDTSIRLAIDDRWMVWRDWQGDDTAWVVFERKPYSRKMPVMLIETQDLPAALRVLMGEDE
jgi:hypothetical protein